MIKPTIGRVVWYKDSSISDQMMPALICYVWNDGMVNLAVHNGNGESFSKTSVPLFHGDAGNCPESVCCWMPYQKQQAESTKKRRELLKTCKKASLELH